MRIGHGVAEFPIVAGEPLGGYADRSAGVADVLDPLEVHTVTFADDDYRFALVTADLVCVNTDVVASVRAALRARLPVDFCWVAATHTHAGPESGCFPGGGATPRAVTDRLVACAVDATRAAVAAEVSSRLQPVRAVVRGLGGRRSTTSDPDLDLPIDALLCIVGHDVAGILAVCPVHPTILSADNNRASADLNGGIRRALTTNGRWAVVATGAAGDISTRHTRRSRDVDEIGRLGRLAAEQIDQARPSLPPDTPPYGVTPAVSRAVRLQPKTPEEVDTLLAKPVSVRPGDERGQWVLRQGRHIATNLARQRRREPYEIHVEAIGLDDVKLVAVPAELYLELGEQIRTRAARDGHTVGGTSIMGLLMLAAGPGTMLHLSAEGPEAAEAIAALVDLVESGFGEECVDEGDPAP